MSNDSTLFQIQALSPLDGRYASKVNELTPFFSEYGLIKYRFEVEIKWLIHLSKHPEIVEFPCVSDETEAFLLALISNFSVDDAIAIKEIEKVTNHDVKAVEYLIKDKLSAHAPLKPYLEFVHFACTSEDINNLSHALMLHNGMKPVKQSLQVLLDHLDNCSTTFASVSMLSRTHGQTASPTTTGKEFRLFYNRIERQIEKLNKVEILGKINGAVGNYNAHVSAYPNLDWQAFSKDFVESLGISWNPYTAQIEPHDYMAELFHSMSLINTIFIDCSRDIWGYISLGYFKQKVKKGEVGSSTMPHKVNPIDFENAEGNFGLANALFDHLANKLPISRWQRDLTDSTVIRNMGVAFGYSQIGYQSLARGFSKLEINEAMIAQDLDKAWEVLAEPIQTVMRKYSVENAYEKLKDLTRGNAGITKEGLEAFIKTLEIPQHEIDRLLELTPQNYIGLAVTLAENK